MNPEHQENFRRFREVSGEVYQKYQQHTRAVFDDKDSPLDRKTMELMALAVSSSRQCKYCVDHHSKEAKKVGASLEEITKAIEIAAVVGSGSTIAYGVESFGNYKT